jgi:hypothetical protein
LYGRIESGAKRCAIGQVSLFIYAADRLQHAASLLLATLRAGATPQQPIRININDTVNNCTPTAWSMLARTGTIHN